MSKKIFKTFITLCLAVVCILFAGCSETPEMYRINVNSLHYNLGAIEGGNKEFASGDDVTIKAIPTGTNNSEFLCWLLNNKVISTDAEYTFVASKQTAGDYLAIFTCPYLEYFALDAFTLNSGIEDNNNDVTVKQIDIYFGKLENVTYKIYTTTSEEATLGKDITQTKNEIYEEDNFPYAYDIQEDIFIKVEITYVKEETEYISSTNLKISGTNDVTLDNIVLKDEQLSTEENVVGVKLNTPISVKDNEQELDIYNDPTFTLKLTRLDTFDLSTPIDEE